LTPLALAPQQVLVIPPRPLVSPLTTGAHTALHFGIGVLRRMAGPDFLPLVGQARDAATGPAVRQELAQRIAQGWPLFRCHIGPALRAAGWQHSVTWPEAGRLIPYIATQAPATEVAWLLLMLRRLGADGGTWPPRMS
jgi:hypothetical protein